ncbi:MAG: hypothetical protein AAGB48_07450 [Planctomycetota bacterium]
MRRWLHSKPVFIACVVIGIGAPVMQGFRIGKPIGLTYTLNSLVTLTGLNVLGGSSRVTPDIDLLMLHMHTDGSFYSDEEVERQQLDTDQLAEIGTGTVVTSRHGYGVIFGTFVQHVLVYDMYIYDASTPLTQQDLTNMVDRTPAGQSWWIDTARTHGVPPLTITPDTNNQTGFILAFGRVPLGWRINPLALMGDLLWLLAILGAIDAWRHRRDWPSRHKDHTRCGYSREGLAADTCPECGETLT